MSRSVNKVILLGRLGKDAESKFLPSGTHVLSFSLATSHRYKDGDEWKEQTNWSNVVKFGGEKLAEYLTKGKEVFVEGRLQTRSYETKGGGKRYVTEVIADEVLLLGGAEKAQAAISANREPARATDPGWFNPADTPDDPF